MPNSQIEMVVKGVEDGREGWLVCGQIDREGRPSRQVELTVIVRQGDVIARGHSTENFGRWSFPVCPDGDGQLTEGSAIASAVAIVEKENPSGLETLTWVQRVKVMERRGELEDLVIPDPEFSETKGGEVANDRAVSSSLAILEELRPGGFEWKQVLEIRKVVESSGVTGTA